MKKPVLLLLLALAVSLSAQSQTTGTTRIYFGIGEYKLTRAHKPVLDSLQRVLLSGNNYKISLIGYTDYLGTADYNKELSERRVASVKSYFTRSRLRDIPISYAHGRGQLEAGQADEKADGIARHRGVDIVLERSPSSKKTASAIPPVPDLAEGETFVLHNLPFQPGRHVVKKGALSELERLYLYLKEHPSLHIEIQGHICCETTKDGMDLDTRQPNLSVTRARFVYDYLVSKGIDSTRLQYKGYARTRPIVKVELTEEDRERNRRVEIKILKK